MKTIKNYEIFKQQQQPSINHFVEEMTMQSEDESYVWARKVKSSIPDENQKIAIGFSINPGFPSEIDHTID